ncbi:hypothetical protein Taro_019508 [Colocasia esculenta]|uniref:Uncharacterized protein n=1 Tax=Colocasia esculenta TaxID=4460 RepID=A0A843UTY9_COLES|nr:hypothetical protein [Colocasia esculenta]
MGSPGGGLLLVAALLLSLSAPSFSSVLYRGAPRQREFDYFLLALQWPGSLCQRTRHCCPKNGCCRSSVALDEFTIHGLWVDYDDGTWPACCTDSRFDIKKVKPLMEKLEKYWPTLSCSSSSNCHGGKGLFWAHEVVYYSSSPDDTKKHGTCSSPVINDEFGYFLTALDLYLKYNITKVLDQAGFSANNSEKYQLSGIIDAVKNSTGASPSLVCSHGAVQELRLCFYKDFKPRDCVIGSNTLGDLNSRSSCPQYVSLPKYIPTVSRDASIMLGRSPDSDDFELVALD